MGRACRYVQVRAGRVLQGGCGVGGAQLGSRRAPQPPWRRRPPAAPAPPSASAARSRGSRGTAPARQRGAGDPRARRRASPRRPRGAPPLDPLQPDEEALVPGKVRLIGVGVQRLFGRSLPEDGGLDRLRDPPIMRLWPHQRPAAVEGGGASPQATVRSGPPPGRDDSVPGLWNRFRRRALAACTRGAMRTATRRAVAEDTRQLSRGPRSCRDQPATPYSVGAATSRR